MKILVIGASGFVGSQIVTDLLKIGYEVSCCVRNVEYTKKLFPQCEIHACDFITDTDKSVWLSRLQNIDIVINTVGIFYHPIKKIIWKTHFETPKALFDACVEVGVKQVIHLSALGVNKYNVDYAKSKLAADDYLSNLPILSTILRPSLIYGRGSYGGTSLFRGLAGFPFFIPVPGKGDQKFQPIYLPDLSNAIVKLIQEPPSQSMILNAVSQPKITLKEMLTILRNWLALPYGYILQIPLFFIRMGSLIGNLSANSTSNSSGYNMLMENNMSNEVDTNKFIKLISFEPRNFTEGTFSQPSTVQDRWHARLYFVKSLLQYSLAFLWLFTAFTSAFLFPTSESFDLLNQIGVNAFWQPILLYGAITLNTLIGIALLLNIQVKKICILQILVILIYTLIITWKLPLVWIEPFGPISKNIPLLVAIYILYILDNRR